MRTYELTKQLALRRRAIRWREAALGLFALSLLGNLCTCGAHELDRQAWAAREAGYQARLRQAEETRDHRFCNGPIEGPCRIELCMTPRWGHCTIRMPADFCLARQKICSPIRTRRDFKQALTRRVSGPIRCPGSLRPGQAVEPGNRHPQRQDRQQNAQHPLAHDAQTDDNQGNIHRKQLLSV